MDRDELKRMQDEHVAGETNKDIEVAVADYADDAYYQNVSLGFVVRGKDQIRPFYEGGWETFPDGEVTIEGEAFGDNVAVHWGTFRSKVGAAFMGVEVPDGRSVEFPVIAVLTFRDGKIQAEHLMADLVGACEQAGVSVDEVRAAVDRSPLAREQSWLARTVDPAAS